MEKGFLEIVKINLEKTLFPHLKFESAPLLLLLAVSGGADSISLLCACHQLQDKIPISISVVTVDHNLRPSSESAGDARFVQSLCERLQISCEIVTLSGIAIRRYAAQKKCGLEAAARRFRYQALYRRKAEIGADFILTAHNRDDYYETVLMRLFQGGNPESLSGLQMKRGCLIRPLLNISRTEILDFLQRNNQEYRTDATNSDTRFLRNRIRLTLTSALDTTFPNWQKGLDKTLAKIGLDCDALEPARYDTGAFLKISPAEVRYDGGFFATAPIAVRRRILSECFTRLNLSRLSFSFIHQCCFIKRGETREIGKCGVQFSDSLIVYKKTDELNGFSVWVDKLGEYYFPHGVFCVSRAESAGGSCVKLSLKTPRSEYDAFLPFELPFYVRSIRPGDKIKIGEDAYKSVKKLLSETGVPARMQPFVPIIEHNGVIEGVWGNLVGGKNRRAYKKEY